MKKAFITGVTGQDGSYLSELLLEKGYEVHGLVRRSSFFNRGRIEDIRQKTKASGQFQLYYGDMTDSSSLNKLIAMIQPDEVYNLAAQSHVAVSFATPDYTAQVDAMGTLRILDAIINMGLKNKTRFYQASTSELYGKVWKLRKRKRPRFIRAVLTASPNCTPTGSPSITGKRMICSRAVASCSTTNLHAAVKIL